MTGGGNKEKKEEPPKPTATGRGGSSLYDKTLSTASNLARLLPTGTTTAFQTLAPSFTNHGECLPINRYFTWALIFFLGVLCAVISFTDSVTDRHGNTRYGFVHPCGFTPFNSGPDGTVPIDDRESKRRRMRGRDWLHSVFRFVVFVSLAFCDSGVQKCLVPRESQQWREFLVNMPLASGFLASFVFMIFPSSRHGIGAGPGAPAALDNLTDINADADADAAVKSDPSKNSKSAPAAADTRVAPSTSYDYELHHAV